MIDIGSDDVFEPRSSPGGPSTQLVPSWSNSDDLAGSIFQLSYINKIANRHRIGPAVIFESNLSRDSRRYDLPINLYVVPTPGGSNHRSSFQSIGSSYVFQLIDFSAITTVKPRS